MQILLAMIWEYDAGASNKDAKTVFITSELLTSKGVSG